VISARRVEDIVIAQADFSTGGAAGRRRPRWSRSVDPE
jgi:hypothetical protein